MTDNGRSKPGPRRGPPADVATVLARIKRPARAVVTAGMPYANGPIHLGHLAGAQLPADIHARWLGLVVGRENVLFVSGTDDHGSTSELAALKAETSVEEFIASIHSKQHRTLERFGIGLDVYSGTSAADCAELHAEMCQSFVRRLHENGFLDIRTTPQWFDVKVGRFLADRLVHGHCPNPKCDNDDAYGDGCDRCGHQYEPSELIDARSMVSDQPPQMRETAHIWLDMSRVSETLRKWIETKRKAWRPVVLNQVLETVKPTLQFDRDLEEAYKELAPSLAKHKRKYTAGGRIALRFESKPDLLAAREALAAANIECELLEAWAHRPISRDIRWGVSLPEIDPALAEKTLYVWPDSLIAPLSFSQVALEARGEQGASFRDYWTDPNARIFQFVGQDNVFFYVLMQGAMWLGVTDEPSALPKAGEYQLTDVIGAFHLTIGGAKMSKSRGNFYTGDQLLDEHGFSADQVRHYLALLGLAERPSDFDIDKLEERNRFLASKLNAAFERPISAAHSKFDGKVPGGVLIEGLEAETVRMVQRYVSAMQKMKYPSMLYDLENYARKIHSLFTEFKPHDDRHPTESRANALFSSFYILKNLLIMLYPFVPDTMNRLRESLRLPESVFAIDELGSGLASGHQLGELQTFFPSERDS